MLWCVFNKAPNGSDGLPSAEGQAASQPSADYLAIEH